MLLHLVVVVVAMVLVVMSVVLVLLLVVLVLLVVAVVVVVVLVLVLVVLVLVGGVGSYGGSGCGSGDVGIVGVGGGGSGRGGRRDETKNKNRRKQTDGRAAGQTREWESGRWGAESEARDKRTSHHTGVDREREPPRAVGGGGWKRRPGSRSPSASSQLCNGFDFTSAGVLVSVALLIGVASDGISSPIGISSSVGVNPVAPFACSRSINSGIGSCVDISSSAGTST